MKNGFKVIDLEHHYATPRMFEYIAKFLPGSCIDGATYGMPTSSHEKDSPVFALGDARLEILEEANIDFAQISLTAPGSEFFPEKEGKEIAVESNDILAREITLNPDRIGAWMSLVPEDPEWSIKEIDRAKGMGLYGWMGVSNINGKYLDDPQYWPILEKIEAEGMPIYIHPNFSPIQSIREFGFCLSGPSLGFTVDVSICLMRMIYRGIFDRFPKLKIVLGHDGEAFPFLKNRIDTAYRQKRDTPNVKLCSGRPQHCPSYYLENNVWITTSGNYLPEALRCCVDVMPKGRVIMSTDFPHENIGEMVSFIADSDFLSCEQKQALLYENARALGFGK